MTGTLRRASSIGAALTAITLAQPALAEAVVVKCTITSGYFPTAEPGVHYYKIGDGTWLQWQGSSKSWTGDYCATLNGDHARCLFDDNQFSASSSYLDINTARIQINRTTGQISASADVRDPHFHTQSSGTCERSTDPPPQPPPPPPKKF